MNASAVEVDFNSIDSSICERDLLKRCNIISEYSETPARNPHTSGIARPNFVHGIRRAKDGLEFYKIAVYPTPSGDYIEPGIDTRKTIATDRICLANDGTSALVVRDKIVANVCPIKVYHFDGSYQG